MGEKSGVSQTASREYVGLVLFLGAKGPGLEANVPHTLLQQVGGSRQVGACRTGESQG